MSVNPTHGLLSAGVVLLAATVASAPPACAAARRPHHRAHHAIHHIQSRRRGNGIPQHNGGDHDADNNGAPSDGDGSV